MELHLGLIEQSFNVRYSAWVREALDELNDSFVITDPCISGHPIVYASSGFLKMFGYSKDEVIGKNGRMFQGPKTSRRSVMEIREAIREEKAIQVSMLNYRKDGTPFWMLFHMCPVYSKEDGKVAHFLGVQVPILGKLRRSGSEVVRNGLNFCEDGNKFPETVFGCCRREVTSDTVMELRRGFALDYLLNSDDRDREADEPCEASELEKKKATAAVNNILSILIHYSQMTGRLVCGKRCCLSGTGLLSASLNISLGRIKQSFVLTDAHLPDMPIVYASDPFLRLTGYSGDEVLGRNCRFLSGMNTDSATQFKIKECIQAVQPCTVCILNYRKDKSSFWNFLHISPIRNATGKVAYFVGVQINSSCADQEQKELSPQMEHLSVVGAVRVAVRSTMMSASTP
uniref:Putative LOV domain-containing protein n=1 Tax=Apocynum androsaemifolium TaxID=61254 RepID=A0A126WYA0_APOAN|nr:putative LOV domain-containing protein [Apocynum androsaemifolium]